MRRILWLAILSLLIIPEVANAFQLHWSSGTDTLTFTQATRAMLVLQADSAEVTLPPEWRLLWLGDSTDVEVVALDSLEVCAGDTARVYAVDGPHSPEDSTSHRVTAHFCSGGNGEADQATILLDLPGWGRGNCMVVALDPADSSKVRESNVVTFNGGVFDTFQPVILATSQSRSTNTVLVSAVGVGLSNVQQASIVAPDSSWTIRLVMIQQAATSLSAMAEVPAALPPALLQVTAEGGRAATAPLAGDTPLAPQWAYSYGSYVSPNPTVWRPKDFTLFYDNLGHFHLFFMRVPTTSGDSVPSIQAAIGHVTGTDLRHWSSVQYTLATRASHWDGKYVWAPFLYQYGSTYYLFYTGVDANDNQSIGVTTTTDINNSSGVISWDSARRDTNIVTAPEWASHEPGLGDQCRDPFVMRSAFSNQFFMFFTTQRYVNALGRWVSAIGVAKSNDLLTWTPPSKQLEIADLSIGGEFVFRDKAESNHAFNHVNRHLSVNPPQEPDTSYYLLSTSAHQYPEIVALLRNRQSPWDPSPDTGADHWQHRGWLYDELGLGCETCAPEDVYNGWEATEYCDVSGVVPGHGSQVLHEYLAGINYSADTDWTAAIWIVMMQWANGGTGPDQMMLLDPVAGTGDGADDTLVQRSGVRLLSRNPSGGETAFEMALSRAGRASLGVFDAQGRHVCTVAQGDYPAGKHRAQWDGRDASGRPMRSGVYFARLDWEGGHGVVRCLILH